MSQKLAELSIGMIFKQYLERSSKDKKMKLKMLVLLSTFCLNYTHQAMAGDDEDSIEHIEVTGHTIDVGTGGSGGANHGSGDGSSGNDGGMQGGNNEGDSNSTPEPKKKSDRQECMEAKQSKKSNCLYEASLTHQREYTARCAHLKKGTLTVGSDLLPIQIQIEKDEYTPCAQSLSLQHDTMNKKCDADYDNDIRSCPA